MQRRSFLIRSGAAVAGLWSIPGQSWASEPDLIAPTSEKKQLPTTTPFFKIPRKLGLTIAISKTLNKIETIDAISAFSDLKFIAILNPETVETQADYIFAKPSSESDRYGLINASTPQNEPTDPIFIEDTLGTSGEAIKFSVSRLRTKLQSLQARKFLQATLPISTSSSSTSSLNAKATLTREDKTWGYGKSIEGQSLQKGDRLRYQIQNLEAQPLYWIIWQTGPEELIILPPLDSPQNFITRKSTQPAMSGIAKPDWTVSRNGLIESFLILSKTPFVQTYQQLIQDQPDPDRFLHPVHDPIAIVNCILNDLNRPKPIADLDSTTNYILDITQSRTFRFTYEVITKSSSSSAHPSKTQNRSPRLRAF